MKNDTWAMTVYRFAMLALVTAACSASSAPTSPTTPSTPPVQFPDLKALAGAYTLTVDLDESCSEFPLPARHRTYRAELEDRGWHYLLVDVVGGGFSDSTTLGELFSGQLSVLRQSDPRLDWNNVDLGCDIQEPLGDLGKLVLCGEGAAVRNASGLDATVNGPAYLMRGATPLARCTGAHRFTFERSGG